MVSGNRINLQGKPADPEQYRWQADGRSWSYTIDAETETYGSYVKVDLHAWKVYRTTPKGAWIWYGGEKKFVLDGPGKRFAHETPELALQSLVARKKRAISIMQARIREAEEVIALARDQVKQLQPATL